MTKVNIERQNNDICVVLLSGKNKGLVVWRSVNSAHRNDLKGTLQFCEMNEYSVQKIVL